MGMPEITRRFLFLGDFNLLESDQVNAWCMPGGKVALFTRVYCLLFVRMRLVFCGGSWDMKLLMP